jgi:hypothetical protein
MQLVAAAPTAAAMRRYQRHRSSPSRSMWLLLFPRHQVCVHTMAAGFVACDPHCELRVTGLWQVKGRLAPEGGWWYCRWQGWADRTTGTAMEGLGEAATEVQ